MESQLMSLDAAVQKAVDRAFAKIDALLVNVVFISKTPATFDFASGEYTTSGNTFSTRAYMQSKKSTVASSNMRGENIQLLPGTVKKTLFMKTQNIDFNGFTQVIVDAITYNCSVIESDKYVTTLEIVGVS